MSRPLLDSIPLGTNMTNKETSPIDSITVETKTSEPTQLTQTKDFPEQNGKEHVLGDPDPDPSL